MLWDRETGLKSDFIKIYKYLDPMIKKRKTILRKSKIRNKTKTHRPNQKMNFWPTITQKNEENENSPVKIDQVEAEIQAYTHTHTRTHARTHAHTHTRVELLVSHQAPPQVADRGMLFRYEGYQGNKIPGADQN